MMLIEKKDYKAMAIILDRMVFDLDGAKELAASSTFENEDCCLLRDAFVLHFDEKHPFLDLKNSLSLSRPKDYRRILGVAMQLSNEFDELKLTEKYGCEDWRTTLPEE